MDETEIRRKLIIYRKLTENLQDQLRSKCNEELTEENMEDMVDYKVHMWLLGERARTIEFLISLFSDNFDITENCELKFKRVDN